MIEQLRWFAYERQRLGRAAPDAATALRDVVAVYSSHPSAPLSLHARAASLTADEFRALDVVRVPAMRGSIHALPPETAHLAFGALPEGAAAAASRLRYFKLTPESYAALRDQVLAVADVPLTAAQLKEAIGFDGDLRGVIGAMGREGLLVRVGADGLRSNALRYVRGSLAPAEPEAALAWLAGEYLRAFGPAREADFRWWAGVTARQSAAALAQVDTVALDGGMLLRAEDEAAFAAARPRRGAVDLLPKWDCYQMGYPADGRARFAHPDIAERCYDFRGDGVPMVLVDGEAAGVWALRPGKRVAVEFDWFAPPGAKVERAVAERVEAVRALLEG